MAPTSTFFAGAYFGAKVPTLAPFVRHKNVEVGATKYAEGIRLFKAKVRCLNSSVNAINLKLQRSCLSGPSKQRGRIVAGRMQACDTMATSVTASW